MFIDIKIGDCEFNAELSRGVPHVFHVGERILADKLFGKLCGLDGSMKSDEVNFSHSKENTVLALGDRTMFLRGSVKKNLIKALKIRGNANRAEEVIEEYNLDGKKRLKNLDAEELLQFAFARSSFRKIDLVVVNLCDGSYLNQLSHEAVLSLIGDRYLNSLIVAID